MLHQKLKYHRIGVTYTQPHFFIRCKGKNSGKPSPDWYSNSFVFLADSEEERWHFYYLCYALWQGKYFYPILTGSVVEFIRIDEFALTLHHANIMISQKPEDFKQMIDYFTQLDQHQENLKKQIALIHHVKMSFIQKVLCNKKAA
jgi:hypothetical protein